MKKLMLILFIGLMTNFVLAQSVDSSQPIATMQRVDTIIKTGIYKSYYSNTLRVPLYVTYTLSKGGGDCNFKKEGYDFTDCNCAYSATLKDYARSGYEAGHLVNAEDFANDCEKEKQTFCFYNSVPQTAKLNRGIWKHWETKVRELSQTEDLLIITGAIYGTKAIGENRVAVPDYCYKIIMSAGSKEMIWCLLFPNDESGTFQSVSIEELKEKLGYAVAEAN